MIGLVYLAFAICALEAPAITPLGWMVLGALCVVIFLFGLAGRIEWQFRKEA